MALRSLGALIVFVLAFVVSLQARQPSPAANLERRRGRIDTAMPLAQGVVGVAIKHLESNVSLSINGDEPFPMASTFKYYFLFTADAPVKPSAF